MILLAAACSSAVMSCTTMKMSVPPEFSAGAREMPVKGLGSFSGRKPVSFGSYKTSRIKRGWNTTSTRGTRMKERSNEEWLLQAMGVDAQGYTATQKDNFYFTISDGAHSAEIHCMERLDKKQLDIRHRARIMGDHALLQAYNYAFSGAIRYGTERWKLVLKEDFDRSTIDVRDIFKVDGASGSGYLVNGMDSIHITALHGTNVTTADGRQARLPLQVLTGYAFTSKGNTIAIVDAFGKSIWLDNELDQPVKLVAASAAAALLLRRVEGGNN